MNVTQVESKEKEKRQKLQRHYTYLKRLSKESSRYADGVIAFYSSCDLRQDWTPFEFPDFMASSLPVVPNLGTTEHLGAKKI